MSCCLNKEKPTLTAAIYSCDFCGFYFDSPNNIYHVKCPDCGENLVLHELNPNFLFTCAFCPPDKKIKYGKFSKIGDTLN